jgi:hypothetical protein
MVGPLMKRILSVALVFSVLAILAAGRLPTRNRPTPAATAEAAAEICTWIPGDPHIERPAGAGRDLTDLELLASGTLTLEEVAEIGVARGLTYLATIDSEGVSSVTAPGFGGGGLTWLIGAERGFPSGRVGIYGNSISFTEPKPSNAGAARFVQDIHHVNGVAQLNRPETGAWTPRLVDAIGPDAIEVWRAGPFNYPTPGLHKDAPAALALLNDVLDSGQHVAAVGGSDDARRAFSDVSGPGQPTTWACVDGEGPVAIVNAIRRGRTTISHDVPANKPPLLVLEGDQDGDGTFEEQMGDSVPPGTTLRVSVTDAPSSRLRLITDGGLLLSESVVDSFDFEQTFEAPAGASWIRAEVFLDEALSPAQNRVCGDPRALAPTVGGPARYCGDRIPMLAVSSPIYVEPPGR